MITKRIDEFDATYSRFRSDSLVTTMSQRSGMFELPDDAVVLLDWYDELYRLSDGAVTPLIGQTLADTGYDAGYSLRAKSDIATTPDWQERLSYNGRTLTLHEPTLLDFGAAGKGYLVDLLASLLENAGHTAYCIDAGGDMVYRHPTDHLQVGLENPDNTTQAIGVATIRNQALCGSATNRRAWGERHHILDPHTATSPMRIKATWVTADSALIADGLTTALFFVTPAKLKSRYTFEYAMLYADGQLEYSPQFAAEFF
jgi:thiamine biosynthesis lipoprotein